MNLGVIYKDLGKFDQALASTIKSLQINPRNSLALESLGDIYFEKGSVGDAEEAYDRAIKLNKQNRNDCLKEKAACLFKRKEYDKCIEILTDLAPVKSAKDHIVTKELGLKATIHERHKFEIYSAAEQKNKEETFAFRISYRLVEDGLLNALRIGYNEDI